MAKSARISAVGLSIMKSGSVMAKAAKALSSKTFDGTSSDHAFEAIKRFVEDAVLGHDDRIAIIVGAAMLHMQLADMLKAFLQPCSKSPDDLFDGEQGLSTFSNQTKLANRMGVLDDDLCFVLDGIRRLRNDYAHDIFSGSLNDPPYSDRIASIAAKYKATDITRHALDLDDSPSSTIRATMVGLSSFISYLRSNVKEPIIAWKVTAAAREAAMEEAERPAKPRGDQPRAVAVKKGDPRKNE